MSQNLEKLKRLRAERSEDAVHKSLDALTEAAKSGTGNLLELAVNAGRAKATVGEISAALETAFHRHQARIKVVSGVYAAAAARGRTDDKLRRIKAMIAAFAEAEGRPPKVLVAKMGQDGHDRGQKVVASAFADMGFAIEIGPLFATPQEVARHARDSGCHVVGVSSLAAGHLTLTPELKQALTAQGAGEVMIVIGGVIPPEDVAILKQMGAEAVYPPGSVVVDAAIDLLEALNRRLGYAQTPPVAVS